MNEKEIKTTQKTFPPNVIAFYSGPPENNWIIEISKDGFKFNREAYPDACADDFAAAFIEIMELKFDITFNKKTTTTVPT